MLRGDPPRWWSQRLGQGVSVTPDLVVEHRVAHRGAHIVRVMGPDDAAVLAAVLAEAARAAGPWPERPLPGAVLHAEPPDGSIVEIDAGYGHPHVGNRLGDGPDSWWVIGRWEEHLTWASATEDATVRLVRWGPARP